ncbi:MAG: hypothetical protein K1X79_03125 [Oligoflexia bacterium]|nr:hypothetical protein [Oligoflexia bacterium]
MSYKLEDLIKFRSPLVDAAKALQGLKPFRADLVEGAWRHRYREAFELLRQGGLAPSGAVPIVDPYTGVERSEDFRNIWEHNLAVGFVVSVIGEWAEKAELISSDEREAAIVHAITHDATKVFEIFRGRFFAQARRVIEIFRGYQSQGMSTEEILECTLSDLYKEVPEVNAFCSYARALAWWCIDQRLFPDIGLIRLEPTARMSVPAMDLDLELIARDPLYVFIQSSPDSSEAHKTLSDALLRSAYPQRVRVALLESRGYGAAAENLLNAFEFSADGSLAIRINWIQRLVLLADCMTASSIPQNGSPFTSYFVTTAERQALTRLSERYPSLTARGVKMQPGKPVEECSADPTEASMSVSYVQIQAFLGSAICRELAEAHAGSPVPDPDGYVKQAVNNALVALR